MIKTERTHKSCVLIFCLKLSLGCINLPVFAPAQAFAEEPPTVSLGQTTAICGDLVCYRTRQGSPGSPWQIHLYRLGPGEAVRLVHVAQLAQHHDGEVVELLDGVGFGA